MGERRIEIFAPERIKGKCYDIICPDKSPFLSMRQKDLSFDISLKTKDLVHFHSGRGLFSFPFDLEKRIFLPFFLLFGVKSILFSIFSSFLFFFLSFFSSLWGKENGEKEDRDLCPGEDKRKMRKHSGFLKMIFRKENVLS